MAIVPLHKSITRAILEEFGFSPVACKVAEDANAEIDKQQGPSVEQTVLHAMAGYRADGEMQSRAEAQKAVAERLEKAKVDIVNLVNEEKHEAALKLLGEVLHTKQDYAFHNFEAWPYNALWHAVLTAPNYMFCHGVRDLGVVSKFDLTAVRNQPRLAIELSVPLPLRNSYISVQGFHQFGPQRGGGHMDSFQGPAGSGGILSFSIGAPPGSLPQPNNRLTGSAEDPYACMVTAGPAALMRAKDASRDYVREVKIKVRSDAKFGGKAWEQFVRWPSAKTEALK